MSAPASAPPIDPDRFSVAARLNRLPVTSLHRTATWVVGLGLFFDLYEVFLAGILGEVLTVHFELGTFEKQLVVASGFVGMFLGAIVLGRLADRMGRRRAFLITLGVYSLFTLLGAFSVDPWFLIVTRFVAGAGLGAELPLADAYLADLLPTRHRGRVIAWAYTLAFFGMPAVGLIGRWLVPVSPLGFEGWRWMFVIGGLGAFAVWLVRRGLPESPRWLESVGRDDEARALVARFERQARAEGGELPEPDAADRPRPAGTVSVATLFRAPWTRRTVMLWSFQVLQAFGYYGFSTMGPLVLAAKGYDIKDSLLYTGLSFLGYPLGSALSVLVVDRLERKNLIVGSAFAMAVLGLAFGFAPGSAAVIAFGFLYTLVSNVFSNAFHVYQGELYPTQVRATAAGTAYSMSRLATAAMPFTLLPLLEARGAVAMYVVVAAAMALLMVIVAALGPRTTGRALEQVNAAPPVREPVTAAA